MHCGESIVSGLRTFKDHTITAALQLLGSISLGGVSSIFMSLQAAARRLRLSFGETL